MTFVDRRRRARPASRWPGRSPSSRTARSRATSAASTRADARIMLLDAADTRARQLRRAAVAQDEARSSSASGVEVRLGARVVGIDATGLDVKDARRSHRAASTRVTKIWAAGVQAAPLGTQLAEQTGAEIDRAGRVEVAPDCTLPGHPEVFVVGDMIGAQRPARASPRSRCRAASTPRKRIVRAARRATADDKPFRYFDKGNMATISRFSRDRRDRQDPAHRLHRLAGLALHPHRLPHRVQEPGDDAAALDGELRRPRPLRARRHDAAGVRADGDAPARGGRGAVGDARCATSSRRGRAPPHRLSLSAVWPPPWPPRVAAMPEASSLPTRARAVVIGGGVIGCSVAYHLAEAGFGEVLLLERDRLTSGTTWHAAGLMVTFGSTSQTSTQIRQYTRDLYARLEAETGQSTGLRRSGSSSWRRMPTGWRSTAGPRRSTGTAASTCRRSARRRSRRCSRRRGWTTSSPASTSRTTAAPTPSTSRWRSPREPAGVARRSSKACRCSAS